MSSYKPVRVTSDELAQMPGELEARASTERSVRESLREQAVSLHSLITGVYESRPRALRTETR